MPVPRLFEAASEPREQWAHVLATVLALGGTDGRAALLGELAGEALPGADAIRVREQRPLAAGLAADVAVHGEGWALAVQTTLAFEAEEADRLVATYDALAQTVERAIVVAVTPDRRPPESVLAMAGEGRDLRHRSWLRLRDWVQERPERGSVAGTDLLLLREAEYFLTPRVAELYRLEGLMPQVSAELRPILASLFLELNELSPAPLIAGEQGGGRIAFPRSGEAAATIHAGGGGLRLRLATDRLGPGFAPSDGGAALAIAAPDDWAAARCWARSEARRLLPARL